MARLHAPEMRRSNLRGFQVGTRLRLLLLQLLCFGCWQRCAAATAYDSTKVLDWLERSSFGYQIFESALNQTSWATGTASEQCLDEVRQVLSAAAAKELWALKFLDAWGKFPAGLLYGHFVEMGNYEQCMGIGHTPMASKYCLANIPFDHAELDGRLSDSLYIRIGVCLPQACSAQVLDKWLKRFLGSAFALQTANTTLVRESNCQLESSEPFTALDWFAVGVLIVLLLLLGLSTICDCYAHVRHNSSAHPLLAAFSLRLNLRQLFHITPTKQAPHIIPCLHGIRCLSIIWIIFGHGYMFLLLSPTINALQIVDWAQTPFSMFLQSGTVSVDTFFFLSGLLLVMITLRELNRSKGKLNVPLMYVHRYLRLTPVLALAVLLFVTLFRHTSNGPLWHEFTSSYQLCDQTWWATLLYVQNYAAAGKMCFGHSWYLAVDMQLYVISPLLLLALWHWGKRAAAGIVVLTLIMLGCLFAIVLVNHLLVFNANGNLGRDSPEMRQIYYSTHARASPWLVGLLFGYYLHCRGGKRTRMSKLAVCGAWLLALAIFVAVLFAVYPKTQPDATPITPLSGAFYLSLSRLGWPLALCWIIFACINGYGEPANMFLSWSVWQPISKLSYCLYIWHLMVETINIGRIKTNTHFSDYDAILFFWSNFCVTLLLSFVMYLAIEAPMVGVEKFMFSAKPKPKDEVENDPHRPTIATISQTTVSQQNLVE